MSLLRRAAFPSLFVLGAAGVVLACGSGGQGQAQTDAKAAACVGDNGGLALPPGFCATVFADNLGHVRHIAAGPDGTIYANSWGGAYYPGSKSPEGAVHGRRRYG